MSARAPGFYWISYRGRKPEPARWDDVLGVGLWTLLGCEKAEDEAGIKVLQPLSPLLSGASIVIPELTVEGLLQMARDRDGRADG